MDRYSRKAFTLAEVLVTLGIIGIVAALTLPQLVSSYRDKANYTKYQTESSKFAQAVNKIYASDGLDNLEGTEDFVKELQKHLAVAKVCKNSELSKCFPQDVILGPNNYKFNSDFNMCSSSILARANKVMNPPPENSEVAGLLGDSGIADIPMMMGFDIYDTMGIVLNNGTSMLITYNPECEDSSINSYFQGIPNITIPKNKSKTQCAAAIIDVNSINKPNTFGKDIFYYNLNACNALY